MSQKIIFADNTELEIVAVFGSARFFSGAQRDVLTIKVNPDVITLSKLQTLFKDSKKTAEMHLVSVSTESANGNPVETRSTLGEQYTMFVSVANKVEQAAVMPGTIAPPESNEYLEVEIAQKTYMEIMIEQILGGK